MRLSAAIAPNDTPAPGPGSPRLSLGDTKLSLDAPKLSLRAWVIGSANVLGDPGPRSDTSGPKELPAAINTSEELVKPCTNLGCSLNTYKPTRWPGGRCLRKFTIALRA